MNKYTQLSIAELLPKLKNREIKVIDLVTQYLDNIHASTLNAYISVNDTQALDQAVLADKRWDLGTARPLEGIPLGIKDLFAIKNGLTTAGSKMLFNYISPFESTVTRRFWNAGAILLGKTNLDQFGMGATSKNSYYGPVINPLRAKNAPDVPLVAGGSSGGSAAAVAGELAVAALGTDTGGSVRTPAAFTGTVGLRPTYGLCSRHGMISFANSLDIPGTVSKTVQDAAILLSSIAGYDELDEMTTTQEVPNYTQCITTHAEGIKACVPECVMERLDAPWIKRMELAKQIIIDHGGTWKVVKTQYYNYALAIYYIIALAEASSNLMRYDGVRYGYRSKEATTLNELYTNSRTEGFGFEVKKRILLGTYYLSVDMYERYFTRSRKVRRLLMQEIQSLFSTYNLIVTPTVLTPPYGFDEHTSQQDQMETDYFTSQAPMVGCPAISIPIDYDQNALPYGIQLMTTHFSESWLFSVASMFEHELKEVHV